MTNETGEVLKALRLSRGMTQQQVADLVGAKTYTTVSKWENGDNSPQGKDIKILSEYFKVSSDTILGLTEYQSTPNDDWDYPFYNVSVAAGALSTIESITNGNAKEITIPDTIMGKYAGNEDIFLMRVNGDSMNKVIPHESMIAVKRVNLDALNNNDIVVFSNDHQYSVKRYYNDVDNKRIIFSSESTDRGFTDHIVPYIETENLIIHGKVVLYIVTTN